MTAAEMSECIASLVGVFEPIGNRIREAGMRGYLWPFDATEFMGYGLPDALKARFANASALAACELQRIVEIQFARNHGGIFIG
jgi:hypothetical protein